MKTSLPVEREKGWARKPYNIRRGDPEKSRSVDPRKHCLLSFAQNEGLENVGTIHRP